MNKSRVNGRIDPAAVAFDVDGVIADTMHLFVDIARQDFNVRDLRYTDITCYTLNDCLGHIDPAVIEAIVERITEGDYRFPLNPMPGAVDVLERLGRGYGPVLMVTARPHPGPMPQWLRTHLDLPDHAVKLISTGDYDAKIDVLQAHGVRYFVEDRLETCFSMDAAGIEPVVFRQPWNRYPHPFREVETWQELASLMTL